MKRAEKYAMSAARIFTDLAQDKGYKAGEPATYFDTLVPYAQHFIDQGYRAIYIPRAAAAAYLAECLAALAPESNTEQAQQNAAELEQAPHPANCACDECRNAFFDELDSQLDQRITKLRKQIAQADMFAATNADLPLFSGTAPRATVSPFVESEVSAEQQPRLF